MEVLGPRNVNAKTNTGPCIDQKDKDKVRWIDVLANMETDLKQ